MIIICMVSWPLIHAKASAVSNEHFAYEHIGFADGLSSQRVYSLVEGKYGEIWISTKHGLIRYNGRTLTSYSLDTDKPYSDAGGRVIRLTVTPGGRLMAYDNKGNIYTYCEALDRFVPDAEAFSLRFEQLNEQGSGLILCHMMEDEQGVSWMATSQGLFVLHPGRGEQRLAWWVKGSYLHGVTVCGAEVVVYGQGGAYVIDRRTGEVMHQLAAEHVLSAYFDEQEQRLWLGTFHTGVCLVDVATWRQREHALNAQLPSLPIRDIELLNDSTLLLGTDGAGVYAARRDGGNAHTLFGQELSSGEVLHGNGIYDILRDSHGNVWMGSYTGGVDVAYPTGLLVDIIAHKAGVEQSLMNDGVNDILEWEGQWAFATDQGVSIYDRRSGRWRHTLRGKVVLTLCATDGGLMAGTYGDGVFRIEASGRAEQAYSTQQGSLATNYIFSLALDEQKRLWIGCLDGPLTCISPQGVRRYAIETVQCLTPMPGGGMAVGTANGFYVVRPDMEQVEHYFCTEQTEGEDVNNYVKSLLFASADTVWIATDGGGLYAYRLSTGRMRHFSKRDGLPSDNLNAIVTDAAGRLLVSTDHGLGMVSLNQGEAMNINFIAGVVREYNRMAAATLADGRMMLGSNQGAVVVNPGLIERLDYQAELRLAGVRVKGAPSEQEQRSLHDGLQRGSLHLSHEQSSLEVRWECICYRYRSDLLYLYRLEGFNGDWSAPSEQGKASFDNLPAGRYTLQVKAVSRNSGRIIDSRSLRIEVDEPWWNSGLARTGYLLLALGVGWMALRSYRGRLERRSFNEKIDFFVNAAHEIRTPLSLVLEPLGYLAADPELTVRSRRYLEMARSNGGKLQTLINELLDFQKADTKARAIRPVPISVRTMLLTECERFALMAQDKGLTLRVECGEELTVCMDVPLSGKLLDNLISNAIKYTPQGGDITLKAWGEGRQVKIEVRDTGIGIPKAAHKMIFRSFFRAENAVQTQETGSGIGLMLARRIVTLHHGSLTFESEEGRGTAFLITLERVEMPPAEAARRDDAPQERALEVTRSGEDGRDVLLFVDDNADLCRYFAMAFGEDYRVATAADGQQALRFVQENECDLVVSDLMMPGMRGDELCRCIKQQHDTSWMPVILLTGVSEKELVLKGLQTGADDYLTKPFDTEILKGKIQSVLANRRRMSAYYLQRVEQLAAEQKQPVAEEQKQPVAEEQKELLHATGDLHEGGENGLFIDKATRVVMERMADPEFSIDSLCSEMAMSRTLLYGRLKTLTAQTPQEFIRTIRLQRAASLLSEGVPILEVTTLVGFTNAKHFSTVFKKQFGLPPSKWAGTKTAETAEMRD